MIKQAEVDEIIENLGNLEFTFHEKANQTRMIAGYEILEVIGQGAFGKVYLARKEDKHYAVKEVSYESKDPEKIYKEVSTLAKVGN